MHIMNYFRFVALNSYFQIGKRKLFLKFQIFLSLEMDKQISSISLESIFLTTHRSRIGKIRMFVVCLESGF